MNNNFWDRVCELGTEISMECEWVERLVVLRSLNGVRHDTPEFLGAIRCKVLQRKIEEKECGICEQ